MELTTDTWSETVIDPFAYHIAAKNSSFSEMAINLFSAANYLIQLFYKTNEKYSCSRTKLGKLLSIVAFRFAKDKKILFREKIYKYNPNCGTQIPALRLYDRDIYIKLEYFDDQKIIDYSQIDDDAIIPGVYQEVGILSDEIKQRITEVFVLFGAYSGHNLALAINKLIELEKIVNDDETINLEAFSDLKREALYQNKESDVQDEYIERLINYLFE